MKIKFKALSETGWIYSSSAKCQEESNQWSIYSYDLNKWLSCEKPKLYTGVSDTFNNELYEGDNVLSTYGWTGDEVVGEIYFEEGTFRVKNNRAHDNFVRLDEEDYTFELVEDEEKKDVWFDY